MGKKSPQTYNDQFARGLIFFCCIPMYAATDNVCTSTFETVRSCSQINKACYGHVYDFGYGNITRQRDAVLATSKVLLENSSHELWNAPINSKKLFDNKIKEVAKGNFEA